MHRINKLIALSAISMAMAGCSATSRLVHRHDSDYLKYDKTDQPLKVPAGTSRKKINNFFPVPGSAPKETTAPSLVPPGTDFSKYTSSANSIKPGLVVLKNGKDALLLDMPKAKAWKALATALPKSGYPVLDHDKAMGAYFILDPAQTGGKTTKKTPIYLLRVYSSHAKTIVTVMTHDNTPLNTSLTQHILKNVQTHTA